jgi:signal peptidase I
MNRWLLIACLAFAGCEQPEGRPAFTGMALASGTSMLPTFGSPEVVSLQLCSFDDLLPGDTVVFWHDGIRDFVHHRLVRRDNAGHWICQGDNNPNPDNVRMTREDFVGRTGKLFTQ